MSKNQGRVYEFICDFETCDELGRSESFGSLIAPKFRWGWFDPEDAQDNPQGKEKPQHFCGSHVLYGELMASALEVEFFFKP